MGVRVKGSDGTSKPEHGLVELSDGDVITMALQASAKEFPTPMYAGGWVMTINALPGMEVSALRIVDSTDKGIAIGKPGAVGSVWSGCGPLKCPPEGEVGGVADSLLETGLFASSDSRTMLTPQGLKTEGHGTIYNQWDYDQVLRYGPGRFGTTLLGQGSPVAGPDVLCRWDARSTPESRSLGPWRRVQLEGSRAQSRKVPEPVSAPGNKIRGSDATEETLSGSVLSSTVPLSKEVNALRLIGGEWKAGSNVFVIVDLVVSNASSVVLSDVLEAPFVSVNTLGVYSEGNAITHSFWKHFNATHLMHEFLLPEPTPKEWVLTALAVAMKCAGSNQGAVYFAASRGVAPFLYNYSDGFVNYYASDKVKREKMSEGNYSVVITDSTGFSNTEFFEIKAELTRLDVRMIARGNGKGKMSSRIQIYGSQPPYSCLWAESGSRQCNLTKVDPKADVVTVTDNFGCFASVALADSFDRPLRLSGEVRYHKPCGATISVAPSDGVFPYTFHWSSGQGNVTSITCSPGSYRVMVLDAFGTMAEQSFAVYEQDGCSEQDDILVQMSVEQSHLEDNQHVKQLVEAPVSLSLINDASLERWDSGSIRLNLSSGSRIVSADWFGVVPESGVITGLVPGYYTVHVEDERGAQGSASIRVDAAYDSGCQNFRWCDETLNSISRLRCMMYLANPLVITIPFQWDECEAFTLLNLAWDRSLLQREGRMLAAYRLAKAVVNCGQHCRGEEAAWWPMLDAVLRSFNDSSISLSEGQTIEALRAAIMGQLLAMKEMPRGTEAHVLGVGYDVPAWDRYPLAFLSSPSSVGSVYSLSTAWPRRIPSSHITELRFPKDIADHQTMAVWFLSDVFHFLRPGNVFGTDSNGRYLMAKVGVLIRGACPIFPCECPPRFLSGYLTRQASHQRTLSELGAWNVAVDLENARREWESLGRHHITVSREYDSARIYLSPGRFQGGKILSLLNRDSGPEAMESSLPYKILMEKTLPGPEVYLYFYARHGRLRGLHLLRPVEEQEHTFETTVDIDAELETLLFVQTFNFTGFGSSVWQSGRLVLFRPYITRWQCLGRNFNDGCRAFLADPPADALISPVAAGHKFVAGAKGWRHRQNPLAKKDQLARAFLYKKHKLQK